MMTNGIGARGLESVNKVIAAVARFIDFNADNDPWGEHDCASLGGGRRCRAPGAGQGRGGRMVPPLTRVAIGAVW